MSESDASPAFDIECKRCPRLSEFLIKVSTEYPDYFARPVPPFGAADARFLIVGLAPGMHGANRTGRPFTGDYAGILLYRTLHEFGFASEAISESADDALVLHDCRISNAVKCLPPQNKPNTAEIKNCNSYLQAELNGLPPGAVVLALGKIAHDAVMRAFSQPLSRHPFGHAAEHFVNGIQVLDSYHCSRYNTQTRRLSDDMFRAVVGRARELLADGT